MANEILFHIWNIYFGLWNIQQHLPLLKAQLGRVILGKDEALDHVLVALLSGSHLLLEDVPGVGKTTVMRRLSEHLAHLALAGFFTVMAKQKMEDPKTGKMKDRITALIVTPDMEGVDIFQRNRAKVCIRGTWQARVRFTNVRVPKENLLPGKNGLGAPLGCLDSARYGIAWGAIGAAMDCYDTALRYAKERVQFDRPIAEFQAVQF